MLVNSRSILLPRTHQCKRPREQALDKLSSAPIYLAAPLSTYQTCRYRRAAEIIAVCHRDARIILPHAQWLDNEHWLATHREVLHPVTTVHVLADAEGFVGLGVWTDLSYLLGRDRQTTLRRAYAFTPTMSLTQHWFLTRWQAGVDWSRYASLIAPVTRHRTLRVPRTLSTLVSPLMGGVRCHG